MQERTAFAYDAMARYFSHIRPITSLTSLTSLSLIFPSLAASLPLRGPEEATGSRHRPHHSASEQLVSARVLIVYATTSIMD